MRLQPGSTLDTSRPFSRSDARAAGLTVAELYGPGFRRLFHDVYVRAVPAPGVLTRAQAAVAVNGPSSYVSHSTSAELRKAVVPDPGVTHVSVPDRHPRSERRGIAAHRAAADAEITVYRGLRVSTPARSILEMATAGVGLVDLVVAADSLMAAESCTLDELYRAAAGWTGRGSRVARRAVSLAREGVDSAMETKTRLLIVLAGLPEPEVNHKLRDEDGRVLLRFDLWFGALMLAVEYDGRQHAESTAQWKRDVYRRDTTDSLGIRLVVVLSEGIHERPRDTLDRVAAALRDRGATVRSRYKPEWEHYFPSR